MESIINSQLLIYLEDHRLIIINDRQYGFRHGRSTGDLVVYLTHHWTDGIESNVGDLAGSLDMAEAFNRV